MKYIKIDRYEALNIVEMLERLKQELPDSSEPEKMHEKCVVEIYANRISELLEEESTTNKSFRRMARLVTILTTISALTALVNIIGIFL